MVLKMKEVRLEGYRFAYNVNMLFVEDENEFNKILNHYKGYVNFIFVVDGKIETIKFFFANESTVIMLIKPKVIKNVKKRKTNKRRKRK